MKTCQNCGGSFEDSEPKCPFCGTLNEEGAEKEYMDKLARVRKSLDNVDEQAVEDYKNELKTFFKVFLITLIIAGLFGALLAGTVKKKIDGPDYLDRPSVEKLLDKMEPFHELVSEWNELFDNGEYDKLYEDYHEKKKFYNDVLYRWKHYRFISDYAYLYDANESYESFLTCENPDHYRIVGLLDETLLSTYYVYYSSSADLFDRTERAVLEELLGTLVSNVKAALDMTDEDFEELRQRAGGNNFPSYSDIEDYVTERWGE